MTVREQERESSEGADGVASGPRPNAVARLWANPVTHLVLATAFLYAGVNVMAPNLTAIAADFGFNARERDTRLGGDVNAAFWLLGAPVSLVHGALADSVNRRNLFVATVLVAQIPALLVIWVDEYWQLLFLRSLCGAAVAGVVPVLYSLLGDMFSGGARADVSTAVGSAMGGGLIFGQIVSGIVGPWQGWRWSFVALAVPGILFALTSLAYVGEPKRGGAEEALEIMRATGGEYTASSLDWDSFLDVLRVRTNLLVFMQGIPGTIPQAVMSVFFNDFLLQDRGLSPQMATLVIVAFGIGAAVGGVGGGVLGGRIYALRKPLLPAVMAGTTILSMPPMYALLYSSYEPSALPLIFFCSFLTGAFSNVSGNNLRTLLLNVNMPESRGTAFCLFNVSNSIGRGAGPAIISALIHELGGRVPAFAVAVSFWALCAICIAGMGFTVSLDEVNKNVRLHRIASNHTLQYAQKHLFVHKRLNVNSHADLPAVADMTPHRDEEGGLELTPVDGISEGETPTLDIPAVYSGGEEEADRIPEEGDS